MPVRRAIIGIDPGSLPRLAARSDATLSAADRAFLRDLELALGRRWQGRVALLVDERRARLVWWMAARWPLATFLCLTPEPPADGTVENQSGQPVVMEGAPNAGVRHALLTVHGPFDSIVRWASEDARDAQAVFEACFFHLRPGGLYVAERDAAADPDGLGLLGLLASTGHGSGGAAVGTETAGTEGVLEVQRHTNALVIRCGLAALPKLRYHEIDRVLAIKPAVGRVIIALPGQRYPSRAAVSMNRDNHRVALAPTINAPSVGLREYRDVICAPHQVLVADQMILPDSYRHYLNRTLTSRYVTDLTERFAVSPESGRPKELSGAYFYLGSEFPQHFGHVMTEQLSRLWAWKRVKAAYPAAKALVDLRAGYECLRPWEITIFGAAGVAEDDLEVAAGAVRVETLLAATPMLVNTQYAHPDIIPLWSRTGDALAVAAPEREYPAKIFVSRRDGRAKRRCRNTRELEACFAAHGYTVVYPEDHSLAEQVMLFRRAEWVAGLAGSGLFTLCFCEPKQVIMIWPETYTSRNEYLICSVRGHDLTVFWCAPDRAHPDGGWDVSAYQSTYAFDFDRDGARLTEVLANG
jgi:capsular polysaccharide biosynthesis protein